MVRETHPARLILLRSSLPPGGIVKAAGFAEALPMAEGPTIGKLTLAAATRNPPF
jgi:hypothetical protein